MRIEVLPGSLLEVDVDLIVNPANSYGYMGGGVAGVIKRFGGEQIEKEAMAKAPIKVGSAVITTAGKLPFKGVVHAPTMEEPAMETTPEKVRLAVRAALELADSLNYTSIAFPGMGTGVGRLPHKVAAQVMLDEIKSFKPKNLKRVVLVDIDERMIEAWKEYL
ncbi:ADP-ribose-binding protein [Thermocrinis minervae]|uniref:O-acetyl-ADP-ribose deacetylase (Regulator of RNase III), contains Macro domain n=1 Tax=Thermocrinis minervae TaxID=381751 RepID=A0A1M6T083_9AQUI|nr:ADP-ribose-binding protein [Thermocrinis minervae]SHK50354.1 O-acetyl-ADP-ribose deacetylase (regulator of RNase III), contains Macro domain [Thermocrinis minervae]